MASMITSLIFITLAILANASNSFRGTRDSAPLGRVEAGEVRAKLQEALDAILSVGSSSSDQEKATASIKDKMMLTFLALPKAVEDRLGPQAVHHILKSYFRQEHGWTLFGFEPASEEDLNQTNKATERLTNESSTTAVLQEKVPAIMAAVLEAREHGQGLTLSEVAAITIAIERLILDESVNLLHMSYDMNGYFDDHSLNNKTAYEVLVTYMALFALPNKSSALLTTPTNHHRWKSQRRSVGKLHFEGQVAVDALANFNFERQGAINPFASPEYTFETTASIADRIAQQYGRRQDEGCRVMREALEAHDVTGTGRVSVNDFHSIGAVSFFYLNDEKLREMGALDESDPFKPSVRIANYVLAPSNCNRNSNYYHVCCISTCDSILNELEGTFSSPNVNPELLLSFLITNMSNSADSDFNITASPLLGASYEHLAQSLRTIAARHNGQVPLHGKLFSKWLHFAFPRDCPLPTQEVKSSEQNAALMKQVAPAEWASDMDFQMPANDTSWAEDDDLPLLEDLKSVRKESPWFRTVLRVLAMAGACIGLLGVSLQHVSDIRKEPGIKHKKKDNDDYFLPVRF